MLLEPLHESHGDRLHPLGGRFVLWVGLKYVQVAAEGIVVVRFDQPSFLQSPIGLRQDRGHIHDCGSAAHSYGFSPGSFNAAIRIGLTGTIAAAPIAGGVRLVSGILATNLGIGNSLIDVVGAIRELTIGMEQGVDASSFSGTNGGVARIDVAEGESIHSIRNGRIVFRDGTTITIRDGAVAEGEADSGSGGNGKSPTGPVPENPNTPGKLTGPTSSKDTKSPFQAGGAHAGGNVAQTKALQAWVDAGIDGGDY